MVRLSRKGESSTVRGAPGRVFLKNLLNLLLRPGTPEFGDLPRDLLKVQCSIVSLCGNFFNVWCAFFE